MAMMAPFSFGSRRAKRKMDTDTSPPIKRQRLIDDVFDDRLFTSEEDDEEENVLDEGDDDNSDREPKASVVVSSPGQGQTSRQQPVLIDTKLFSLIEEQKWDEVLSNVQELRQVTTSETSIPALSARNDVLHELMDEDVLHDGYTPLQWCLYLHANGSKVPRNVIDALVDRFTAQDPYPYGELPLHTACNMEPVMEGVVLHILNAYPEAVLKDGQDGNGGAVHIVLHNKPSIDLVEKLMEAWARCEGVNVDEAWNAVARKRGSMDELPLNIAIQNRAPSNIILKLINAYPESVTVERKSKDALPPLHMAALRGCSLEVMTTLLKGAGGTIADRRGEDKSTPLHLLFNLGEDSMRRWRGESAEMLPPGQMALHLIKTHANYSCVPCGVKRKGAKPLDRAVKLVNKIKDRGGWTVKELAQNMRKEFRDEQPYRCPDDLNRVIEAMDRIGTALSPFDGTDSLSIV